MCGYMIPYTKVSFSSLMLFILLCIKLVGIVGKWNVVLFHHSEPNSPAYILSTEFFIEFKWVSDSNIK